MNILLITTAFMIKHFICDYPLQKPFQFLNKGKYGHPGGILHAAIHGLGTIIALCVTTDIIFGVVVGWALLESAIHYHVDWAKMKINDRYKLIPSASKQPPPMSRIKFLSVLSGRLEY